MYRCTLALIFVLFVGCSQDVAIPTTPAPDAASVDESTAPQEPSSDEIASVTVPPDVVETVTIAPEANPDDDAIAAESEFAQFLEGNEAQRARLEGLLANPSLPAFGLTEWHNSEALDWPQLEGKLVLLDFWATWCGPCIRSVPHTNEMARRYTGEVVILGVCAPRGAENLEETVARHSIEYPVAVDTGSAWNDHFAVNGFPDYYLIGRDGELLAADISNSQVDAALVHFLNQ